MFNVSLKNAAMQHIWKISERTPPPSSSEGLAALLLPSCQSESKPGASPPAPGFFKSGRRQGAAEGKFVRNTT